MTREDIVESIRQELIPEYGDTDQAEEMARDMANDNRFRRFIIEEELASDAAAYYGGRRICPAYSVDDDDDEPRHERPRSKSAEDQLKEEIAAIIMEMLLILATIACDEVGKLIKKGWRKWRGRGKEDEAEMPQEAAGD